MAKFLTTRGVTYEIENIIKNAKRFLVLISPYISTPESLLQSLKEADRRKVRISFFGDGSVQSPLVCHLD